MRPPTKFSFACFFMLLVIGLADADDTTLPLASPDGSLQLSFALDDQGRAAFDVSRHNVPLVTGTLSLELLDVDMLGEDMRIIGTQRESRDYESAKVWDIADDVKPLVGLPILLEHPLGDWIAVTEAGLTDYAGAYLVRPAADPHSLTTVLAPLPVQFIPKGSPPGAIKVIGETPFQSPWRVLMIADGLDIAWYGGPIQPNGPTDVTTAAASIDMPELLRYAKQKGDLPLDFLDNSSCTAELYVDDVSAGPTGLTLSKQTLSANDSLHIVMPPSGGFVARFKLSAQ